MEKILISACLNGCKVRYHGGDATCDHKILTQWRNEDRLVEICPEVSAGLSTPRTPSEIIGIGGGGSVLDNNAKVASRNGVEITDAFLAGANLALNLALKHDIKIAILKSNSPSCGNSLIYDGTFNGTLIPGMGVTAALLTQHGIKVFNETEIENAANYLQHLEQHNKK